MHNFGTCVWRTDAQWQLPGKKRVSTQEKSDFVLVNPTRSILFAHCTFLCCSVATTLSSKLTARCLLVYPSFLLLLLLLNLRRCKTSSVGQSAGLLIPRSSVRFRQKLKKSRTQIYMDLSSINPQARGKEIMLFIGKPKLRSKIWY